MTTTSLEASASWTILLWSMTMRFSWSQSRAAQSACRGRESGSLCHFEWLKTSGHSGITNSTVETVWGHCYLLETWRDGSGGAFDFDGHLRSTLLACLRDQLTADELVAAGVTEGSGSADSENSVRLQEIFAWVIGGGWQVLVAVSATLCCSVGAAAFLTYRCFQPEANTFMGWLPIENPGSSAQAQRPARVGVKKRHLRVHEHLKAQIKGHKPLEASPKETQAAFSYDAELQAAGLSVMGPARSSGGLDMAPPSSSRFRQEVHGKATLLPPSMLRAAVQAGRLEEDDEPGTCSSATALLQEPSALTQAFAFAMPRGESGLQPEPSVLGRGPKVQELEESSSSSSSGAESRSVRSGRSVRSHHSASKRGRGMSPDKWEAMALELSCLDDDPLPSSFAPRGQGFPQRPEKPSRREPSSGSSSSSSSEVSEPMHQRQGSAATQNPVSRI